ncbi:hypothetical protein F4778DRAFT_785472 [Xylariomycetidae sp. FL2044]|nr:hypothetical protein F4778DRAFT_785472 [Xylariomycetidae sp. FL2044]
MDTSDTNQHPVPHENKTDQKTHKLRVLIELEKKLDTPSTLPLPPNSQRGLAREEPHTPSPTTPGRGSCLRTVGATPSAKSVAFSDTSDLKTYELEEGHTPMRQYRRGRRFKNRAEKIAYKKTKDPRVIARVKARWAEADRRIQKIKEGDNGDNDEPGRDPYVRKARGVVAKKYMEDMRSLRPRSTWLRMGCGRLIRLTEDDDDAEGTKGSRAT